MQNKTSIKAVGMQHDLKDGSRDTGVAYFSKLWQDGTHEYRCVKVKEIDQNYELRKTLHYKKKLESVDLQTLGLASTWNFLYPFGQDSEFVVSRAKA